MLGFVVAPKGGPASRQLSGLFSAFKTLVPDTVHETARHNVWTYRTLYPNNYRVADGNGRVIVATGTLMLGRVRGQQAVERVAARLDRGDSLRTVFADLRGSFAVLVVDAVADRISLLTDRDGLMCCYQSEQSGERLTSTSLLLLAALGTGPTDALAAQEFIHGGACVDGRTLFDGIRRLPAASQIELAGDQAMTQRLWDATVHAPYLPDSDGEIVDTMHRLFSSALDTELRDPQKAFAADLTAGTDSRTVLSFLLKSGTKTVASTAGLPGNVDVERAQTIASKAGIEHYWYPVENTVEFGQALLDDCVEYSDGVASPFSLAKQIPYFDEKAKRFDILFGGNGGPLFKDHYWLFEFNRIDKPGEPNWSRIARYSLTEGRVRDDLFQGGVDYLEHMKGLFMQASRKISGTNNQKLDFMYFDLKCQHFAAPQFSFSNKFMDIYHPMCDGRLVEYSLSIRPWIRQRARLQSELIYRNHRDIAWVPTDNYVPCVPDTGLRSVLRLTRGIRYARAAQRKISDFVLNKRQVAADPRSLSFVQSLQRTDLYEAYRQPENLRLAPLLNAGAVGSICAAVGGGAHSGYLQRIFAVEAILKRVEALRGRAVTVQSA